MVAPLLKTKLYIPPVRPELISRPRLIERLNAGLHRKLTFVSAAAGFGKTTLVLEWLDALERPFTWLSLDEGDNDPARFLAYLIAALQRVDERIGQTAQGLLGSPQVPAINVAMTALINDITSAPELFVLVLDDYHHIHAEWIHEAVAFLLTHQPPQLHLVLTTRADPPLPLPRLRVRDHATEIRTDDLRFTTEEADPSTQLIQMGARWYDGRIGRWVSADTIVPSPANPQSLKRFAYVGNRPVAYTDPSGHIACLDQECLLRVHPVTGGIVRHGVALEEIQGQIEFVGEWDVGSRYNVLSGARAVAGAMERSSGIPAALAYHQAIGRLSFVNATPGTVSGGWAWTRASDLREVWVDAVGTADYLQWGVLNTIHELGHAYAQLNPGTYSALEGAHIRNALGDVIAGGTAGEHGRTLDGYAVAWGDFSYERYFMTQHGQRKRPTWPWVQNSATAPAKGIDPVHEDFADMFVGWAFGHFANDPQGAGAARLEWMTTSLGEWAGD